MNILTTFLSNCLKQSMPMIGGSQCSWRGRVMEMIQNEQRSRFQLAPGLDNPDGGLTILVQASSFSNGEYPRSGDEVIIDRKKWEVDAVRIGKVGVFIDLTDPDKSSVR